MRGKSVTVFILKEIRFSSRGNTLKVTTIKWSKKPFISMIGLFSLYGCLLPFKLNLFEAHQNCQSGAFFNVAPKRIRIFFMGVDKLCISNTRGNQANQGGLNPDVSNNCYNHSPLWDQWQIFWMCTTFIRLLLLELNVYFNVDHPKAPA